MQSRAHHRKRLAMARYSLPKPCYRDIISACSHTYWLAQSHSMHNASRPPCLLNHNAKSLQYIGDIQAWMLPVMSRCQIATTISAAALCQSHRVLALSDPGASAASKALRPLCQQHLHRQICQCKIQLTNCQHRSLAPPVWVCVTSRQMKTAWGPLGMAQRLKQPVRQQLTSALLMHLHRSI